MFFYKILERIKMPTTNPTPMLKNRPINEMSPVSRLEISFSAFSDFFSRPIEMQIA
jgi:hypothetical protein